MKRWARIVVVLCGIALLFLAGYFWNRNIRQNELTFQERMKRTLEYRDTRESAIIEALDDIDRRLDSIRDTEGYLIIGPGSNFDGISSKKVQILNNINMMREIISDNRIKISSLEKQLEQMSSSNRALRNKLLSFSRRNEDLLAQLTLLREQTEEDRLKLEEEKETSRKLIQKLEEKDMSYAELKKKFDKVESDAYTAYYIAGSKKQLRTLNVVEKKKSVLSLSPKAEAYFPSAEFERLDARDEAIIPVHSEKAELITPHAKGSYVWREDEEGIINLCITNPGVFWQSSKYLVIETK